MTVRVDRRLGGNRGTGSGGLSTIGKVALGLLVGVAAGFVAWTQQQEMHQRALFAPSPRRRLAALGYLRAHPSVDSARLLRDYLRWEPLPLLRRRARGVLRRTERLLRS